MPVQFARVALVAVSLLALAPLPALAIGEKPSILLHLVPAGASPTCAAGGRNDHAGLDIINWGHCGDIEFASPNPSWPAPGSGNTMVFMPEHGNCQTGELAVVGWFYLAAYAPGRLSLIPRQSDGVAKVANCSSAEFGVPTERLGFVDFSASGVEGGCNPLLGDCVDQVAVEARTWSGVKTLVSR